MKGGVEMSEKDELYIDQLEDKIEELEEEIKDLKEEMEVMKRAVRDYLRVTGDVWWDLNDMMRDK